MKKIILASASPRRKELLERAGVLFTVMPAEDGEETTKTEPEEVVKELSLKKAKSVAAKVPEDAIVIGADTVVSYEGKILGKPKSEQDAEDTLRMLQGNTHQVYTGVTVLRTQDGKQIPLTFCECTDVTFYPISGEEIRAYVRSGDGADKAGGYGIQGYFGSYVKGICGDYSNVVGLPVARLLYETKKIGMDLRGEEDDQGMYI